MTAITPLPSLFTETAVRDALREDLGDRGDITTQATVPSDTKARIAIRARQKGCLAGLDLARTAFRLVDPTLKIAVVRQDSEVVAPGDEIAYVEGSARSILTAERVALNYLGHLSGIASVTSEIVQSIAHTNAKVCCTRKTTPGLRAFEKYAVRAGGGENHRFGLYDAILIKDNHIAMAGGIKAAIVAALAAKSHMVKVEVEVDNIDQLNDALAYPIDVVLLDNMTTDQLREAVSLIAGRTVAEASGGITPQSAPGIAETGVDLLSVGWITHSAPCLDIGLDFEATV